LAARPKEQDALWEGFIVHLEVAFAGGQFTEHCRHEAGGTSPPQQGPFYDIMTKMIKSFTNIRV
jgi:hypothetical protein